MNLKKIYARCVGFYLNLEIKSIASRLDLANQGFVEHSLGMHGVCIKKNRGLAMLSADKLSSEMVKVKGRKDRLLQKYGIT